MQFHSIRFKINVLYTLILGAILLAYSGVLFFDVRTLLYRDVDEGLRVKAEEVGSILKEYERVEQFDRHPFNFLSKFYQDEAEASHKRVVDNLWYSQVKTLNLKNDYIQILTPTGQVILSSESVKTDAAALFHQQFSFSPDKILLKDLKDERYHVRAINYPFRHNGQPWLIIQIGTPLASVAGTLNKLLTFILVAMSLILFVASFLGNVFVQGVLTPVRRIAETANRLSHKDLHVRVEGTQTDAEIRYLVDAFNTMLGRLETSFGHINEFSSHVAHELKTPLAILRGEMELALNEPRTADELKKVLEVGMEEVNRLIRIVKDLLLLANLDYRTGIFKFEKINLGTFVEDICENGKILAREKNIHVVSDVTPESLFMDGDKVHLRRLFFNLLHNAVKFTPPGGEIRVTLVRREKTGVIAVADTGVGIAPKDLEKLFTKFFRAAGKDQRGAEPGNGLGLSIAQSIAKAHQGLITVESVSGQGTVFTVTLPLI